MTNKRIVKTITIQDSINITENNSNWHLLTIAKTILPFWGMADPPSKRVDYEELVIAIVPGKVLNVNCKVNEINSRKSIWGHSELMESIILPRTNESEVNFKVLLHHFQNRKGNMEVILEAKIEYCPEADSCDNHIHQSGKWESLKILESKKNK